MNIKTKQRAMPDKSTEENADIRQRVLADRSITEFQRKELTEENAQIRQRVIADRSITEFQRKVYLELLNVPRGEVITYGELARRVGCRSAQAVGQALKRNPYAPDVPCHRVIAADGSLGGFYGQRNGEMIEKKWRLLAEEGYCTL